MSSAEREKESTETPGRVVPADVRAIEDVLGAMNVEKYEAVVLDQLLAFVHRACGARVAR